MPQQRNRSQKLAAKAARRRAVVAEKKQAEQRSLSLPARVAVAGDSPLERCVRTVDLFEVGIGHVILAKRLPTAALGCAFFLVDVYCLGVKDAFYKEMAPSELEETLSELDSSGQTLVDMDPSAARKLVSEAVAYAAACGLGPAEDYTTLSRIFGAIDADQSSEAFTFGKDGKPFYVRGPRDKPARVREIMRALNRRLGPEGWDYLSEDESGAILDLLDEDADDAPVIEHEGPTVELDRAAVEDAPGETDASVAARSARSRTED